VAVPNGQFVGAADRQDNTGDLVGKRELLPNEGQDEILPDLIGVTLGEL